MEGLVCYRSNCFLLLINVGYRLDELAHVHYDKMIYIGILLIVVGRVYKDFDCYASHRLSLNIADLFK